MNLELTYCSMWNYEPQAVSLAARVLSTFKQQVRELKLIPASGGCFELKANGQLIYSKLQTGKFPEEQEMIDALAARLR